MEIKIKTLTPIWTGDIDQRSRLLQTTGILGSLRYWSEAILRSIGRYACDPTSDCGRCPKEVKNKKYYCSACLIFGATGIRRTFRLNMSGGKRVFTGGILNIRPSGRNRGWYLGSGVLGEIYLKITSLDKDFDESLVLLPLIIASKWGGIGAKIQHGYGVVKIEICPRIDFNRFREAIGRTTDQERLSQLSSSMTKVKLRHGSNDGLPNLREMFFAKVQFEVTNNNWWKEVDGIKERGKRGQKNYYEGHATDRIMMNWIKLGSVPITPAVKNWLRYRDGRKLWKKSLDEKVERWLFGTTKRVCTICYERVKKDKDNLQNFWCPQCKKSLKKEETFERIASKINISCAYPVNDNIWEFRIWGWIPESSLPTGFDRKCFLNNLKQALNGSGFVTFPWNELLGNQTKNHKLKVWREFNSSRDSVRQNEGNISNYIQSLLEGGE